MWEQLLSFPSSVGNFLPMQSRTRLARHCVLYKTKLTRHFGRQGRQTWEFLLFSTKRFLVCVLWRSRGRLGGCRRKAEQRGFWDVYYAEPLLHCYGSYYCCSIFLLFYFVLDIIYITLRLIWHYNYILDCNFQKGDQKLIHIQFNPGWILGQHHRVDPRTYQFILWALDHLLWHFNWCTFVGHCTDCTRIK